MALWSLPSQYRNEKNTPRNLLIVKRIQSLIVRCYSNLLGVEEYYRILENFTGFLKQFWRLDSNLKSVRPKTRPAATQRRWSRLKLTLNWSYALIENIFASVSQLQLKKDTRPCEDKRNFDSWKIDWSNRKNVKTSNVNIRNYGEMGRDGQKFSEF